MPYLAKHISISIAGSPDKVYEFVSNPENVPKWAAGLGSSIRNEDGDWIADSPMGEIKVRFADRNKFGVLDHTVTLPTEQEVYVPMRVLQNNDGSEVVFTLYRREDMTEEQFNTDAKMVERDLKKLKEILEK